MRPLLFVIAIVLLPSLASAHDAEQAVHAAWLVARASVAAPAPENGEADEQARFDQLVRDQASLEIQLALRFYAEYDDYRAITSLRRYHFLDNSPRSKFLSSLMIGQIYHRNEKPELAVMSFEEAAKVAERPYDRTFAYLMALQEMCLPLSFYAQCRERLAALAQTPMEPEIRELIDYQVLYTDVVLRSDHVSENRLAMFAAPLLVEKGKGLIAANRAFDELPLKRPWLAGTLSALLPGSGQLYNGRPVDGLVSLLVNGAFGAATYYSFAEARSIPLGIISAVFLAGFYSGNIVNAVTDAKRVNAQRYLDFFEQLKVDYWPRVSFGIEESEVLFTYGFDWPGPTLSSRAAEASEGAPSEEE